MAESPVQSGASEEPATPRRAESGGRFRYSADLPVVAGAAPSAGTLTVPSAALDWERVSIGLAAAAICILILYRSELFALVDRWNTDPGWSHGFVVPLISVFFVWTKWETLRRLKPQGSMAGLVLVAVGIIGQVLFRATGTVNFSDLSIVVLLYGAVLFLFGWQYLRVLWLPISFLLFAVPPPTSLYVAVTTPMQKIAAELGTRLLPLFGAIGFREGTTIQVQKGSAWVPLDVAQACSGMRMLVAFFALAVALSYSTNRPMWQKVFLAACALPIAILCNALRVTLTGVLAATYGMEYAKGSTHETVGLLMLIPALFMQLAVAWVLDRIYIDDDHAAGGKV